MNSSALSFANHNPLAGRSVVGLAEFAGQTFCFYSRNRAPAHFDILMSILDSADVTFPFREDPIPGLRHLSLEDGHSFTLVPKSMADNLGSELTAVGLTDEIPTFDLYLIWRHQSPVCGDHDADPRGPAFDPDHELEPAR